MIDKSYVKNCGTKESAPGVKVLTIEGFTNPKYIQFCINTIMEESDVEKLCSDIKNGIKKTMTLDGKEYVITSGGGYLLRTSDNAKLYESIDSNFNEPYKHFDIETMTYYVIDEQTGAREPFTPALSNSEDCFAP